MKNIFKTVFIFFLVIEASILNAQSLTAVEKKYEQLKIQFERENRILDSLQSIYSFKTAQIDLEKKKKNSDNEKIIDLMAGSVAISNKIENQNKKVIAIQKEIEIVKQQLHNLYLAKIDSLESLKNNDNIDEDKIDAEILHLTEKNISVAPKIVSLSFNPQKILEIDLQKTSDPKERELYREYLNNALNEVNDILDNVTEQLNEVNQIIALQTKTRKFLEETELENNLIIQNQVNQNNEQSASSPNYRATDEATPAASDLVSNVKTYQFILNQLDIQQISKTDLKLKISSDELNRNLDVKEYRSLLNEVKRRLQEYKLVLANKIGSAK